MGAFSFRIGPRGATFVLGGVDGGDGLGVATICALGMWLSALQSEIENRVVMADKGGFQVLFRGADFSTSFSALRWNWASIAAPGLPVMISDDTGKTDFFPGVLNLHFQKVGGGKSHGETKRVASRVFFNTEFPFSE
ncbi:hypothetical protein [Dickeya dadantii]|uniref:hypothetical protein n=1 Tax=Dickeya dadantii TaxID=204038 RepID=UPI001C0B8A98|nr:hypothetical protein [Dickeya dadantii]QWT40602.1 hypothetical protein KNV89_20190 [Dickeya dadantii]